MRFRVMSGLLTAVVFCMSLTACGGGTISSAVPDQIRATKDCPIQLSVGRSVQSVRSTKDDCGVQDGDGGDPGTGWNTPVGDPGLYFDNPAGDTFYGAEDNWGNPCPSVTGPYASIGCTHSINTDPYYSPIAYNPPELGPIEGTIGAPAQRNDNCTIVPGMAVGATVPGAPQNILPGTGNTLTAYNNSATVTNQSTLTMTVTGGDIQTIGWVYGTKGDGYFFVPNLTVALSGGPVSVTQAVPGTYQLPSSNVNSPTDLSAILSDLNSIQAQYGFVNSNLLTAIKNALNAWLNNLNPQNLISNTPCYTKALPRNG